MLDLSFRRTVHELAVIVAVARPRDDLGGCSTGKLYSSGVFSRSKPARRLQRQGERCSRHAPV